MTTENAVEPKQAMWRVSEEMTERVNAAKPKLEDKLRVRLSRTQVIDYLLDAGLTASGLEPADR